MFSCRSVWRRCGLWARTSAHRLLPVVVRRQPMSSVPGGSGENIVYALLCGGAFVGAVSYAYITVSTDNARYNAQIEQIKARSKQWMPKVWPPKSKDDEEGGEEEKTVAVNGGEEEEEEAAAEAEPGVEVLAEVFTEAAEVVVKVAEGVAEAVQEVEEVTEEIQVVETVEEAVEAVAKPADITAEDPESNVLLAALTLGIPKEEFTPVEEATVPTGVAPTEGTPTLAELAPVKGTPAQAEVAPVEEAPLFPPPIQTDNGISPNPNPNPLMEATPAEEAPAPVGEAPALIKVAVVEEAAAPAEVAPVEEAPALIEVAPVKETLAPAKEAPALTEVAVVEEAPAPAEVAPVEEVPASMEVVPVKEAPAPEVKEAIVLEEEMPAPVVEASVPVAFTQVVETACEVPVESLVEDPEREYIFVVLDGTPKPEKSPKLLGVAPTTGRIIPSRGDALASE